MSARSHADRVADRQLRCAELLMRLADEAGVSRSPSQIRYLIASLLGEACSQSTVQRLHLALERVAPDQGRMILHEGL